MVASRWKIMAGMFGLSLGGLALLTGQGFKKCTDTKCHASERPTTVVFNEPPLVVQASALMPAVPPAELVIPAGPSIPVLEPTLPPVCPTAMQVQVVPMELPVVPPMPFPTTAFAVETAPMPKPVCEAPLPRYSITPEIQTVSTPREIPEATPIFVIPETELPIDVTPLKPAPSKYRITLRVGGDGEPVFEVRNGDELLLKVMSEKVDVKSPIEKGQNLASIKAMGKVRFVGFGSEGVCDELSVLAGTGDVTLGGNVKVQVKDKFGRTETELTGDKMNYRLDAASSLAGGLQP